MTTSGRQSATDQTGILAGSADLPRLLATGSDPSLDGHLRRWGPVPAGALPLSEVERSGLRGRGGAAFPTARKLATVAAGSHPVVLANGTEGEPVSRKDKTLLVSAPHLVLDGMIVAAQIVGADEAVLCVERRATRVAQAVQRAAAERAGAGVDPLTVRIETAPAHYVAGEETALVRWLNGGEAKPSFVPPRPFEKGVRGRPTLVNNVETFAHLALIARFGAAWFRSVGTPEDPGTVLVTISGDVAKPGVCEVPFGTDIGRLLVSAGAGSGVHSLLVGGYAGTWIPAASASRLSLDHRSLASTGATIGCASLVVLGAGSCGLEATARIGAWMASQSSGQCGPCTNGLPAIAYGLQALAAGDRRAAWESQLYDWLGQVEQRGACHHPDGVARMVRSALEVFAAEIAQHRRHGHCRARPPALPFPHVQAAWR